MSNTTTTIPAPLSWAPSSHWDGNDGNWNTFVVSVGTPPQDFRILPSTSGQEIWLPDPEGCTAANPSDPGYCGYLRGTLPINGANSSGFAANRSSSWDLIGPFELDAVELGLGYTGNGLYGFDTVALDNASTTVNQTKSVVASVPDLDFWLGYFGLGPKSINFTTFNNPIPNYLSNLVTENKTLSLSWGYTAGAYYRDQTPASLTLGGYDTNRFEATNINFAMNADNSRQLQVGVQKIVGQNTLGGSAVNLLPTAAFYLIDSTVPHLWLPDDSIESFVDNFGLTYDNNTDLFLINDTMRQQMLSLNPTVTLVLSNNTIAGTDNTQNIQLPYAAFDLQASYPFYQNATNYFPIRRANSTQYTIGRTFLQEAYLIADYDRGNFTVAQTSFSDIGTQHLVAIPAPAKANSTHTTASTSTHSSTTLSGGAIAGIVVGAIAGLTAVGLIVWFLLRRRKHKHSPVATEDPAEPAFPPDKKDGATAYMHRDSELPVDNALFEAPDSRKPSELPSPGHMEAAEVEGDLGKGKARPGMVEMPGGDARYELPGSEVR